IERTGGETQGFGLRAPVGIWIERVEWASGVQRGGATLVHDFLPVIVLHVERGNDQRVRILDEKGCTEVQNS
ncbi:MAG TPA: hypothetical protein VLV83_18870, partial [Acidobacteriota bacterium]|nr:hypothetical protein [Acidobacteriota bacterium]